MEKIPSFLRFYGEAVSAGKDIKTGEYMLFRDLKFDISIQKTLEKLHYTEMFPIQEKVIPLLCNKQDVIAQSKTGSGKTAAYLLPIMQNTKWDEKEPQALILTPTRELALQVKEEYDNISMYQRLKCVAIFGKQPYKFQIEDLKQRTHAVVGTPGRVLDHLERGTLSLDKIQYVILDEADEMLKMGFLETVVKIMAYFPKKYTTALFSATMPQPIMELAEKFMKEPVHIKIEDPLTDTGIHYAYEVKEQEKISFLIQLLCKELPQSCIVFAKTQANVIEVCDALYNKGMNVDKLHGGMLQEDRIQNIKDFKKGIFRILVATDVAARGIDIDDVTHIINYDMPNEKETYVHRKGRTGRAFGKQGVTISFLSQYDTQRREELEEYLGYTIEIHDREEIDNMPVNEEILKRLGENPQLKKDKAEELRKDTCKLYINKGKSKKIRAGDIVGAICQIEGVQSEDIGVIQVQEHQSYVDILNGKGKDVLKALNQKTIKGKKIKVEIAKEN